jgi:membrane-bound ClpP family serine protease
MILIGLLALIGLVLIFLEFFLPGMIFAICGTILLLSSVGLFFIQNAAIWGLFYLFSLLVLLVGTCKIALLWIKKSKDKDQFYLENNQEGYVAAQFDKTAIGKKGIAYTELKPAGHIFIEGKTQQALCETGYVQQGAVIHVVGGKGGHLIVKPDSIET